MNAYGTQSGCASAVRNNCAYLERSWRQERLLTSPTRWSRRYSRRNGALVRRHVQTCHYGCCCVPKVVDNGQRSDFDPGEESVNAETVGGESTPCSKCKDSMGVEGENEAVVGGQVGGLDHAHGEVACDVALNWRVAEECRPIEWAWWCAEEDVGYVPAARCGDRGRGK